MLYAGVKNSFEFKISISSNPLLKWAIFVLNFESQLVDPFLLNVNQPLCGEFSCPVVMPSRGIQIF